MQLQSSRNDINSVGIFNAEKRINSYYETTVYLEKFIRNLLLGEKNELKNRYLHINAPFDKNVGVNGKNVGVKINETQRKIVELLKNNPNSTIEKMSKYVAVTTRTIERNIRMLKEKGIIDRVGADKNGHWIVII